MRVHIAHIQVTNPLGILMVGFVALLGFRVFWIGQSYPAGFLKDSISITLILRESNIKHRYPKLTGGFHTNIVTVVFGKPVSQFLQAFCKGGKASLLILCTSICVSNSHTGVNPSLVNIQSTAVFAENLKCHIYLPR